MRASWVNVVNTSLLQSIAELAHADRRPASARALARSLGGEELMVFLRDAEVEAMLPAPGFPQTLPNAREWQAFLARCQPGKICEGTVSYPDAATQVRAVGFAADGEAAIVFLGGELRVEEAGEVAV